MNEKTIFFGTLCLLGLSIAMNGQTRSSIHKWTVAKRIALDTRFIPRALALADKKLAAVLRDQICVWDTSTWQLVKTVEKPGAQFLTFAPESALLALTTLRKELAFYETERFEEQGSLKTAGDITAPVAFSADSRLLAVCTFPTDPPEGRITLYETKNLKPIRTIVTKDGDSSVYAHCFSPNSNFLVTGNSGGGLTLWSVITGEQVRRFHDPDLEHPLAHVREIGYARFSSDGRFVISGDARHSSSVKVWEVETGRKVREWILSDDPVDQVQGLDVSRDGRFLAVSSMRRLVVFNTDSWQECQSAAKAGNEGGFAHVAFAPDSKALSFIDYPHRGSPKQIVVWKFSGGELGGGGKWGQIEIIIAGARDNPEVGSNKCPCRQKLPPSSRF
jgi:WD40 repeat protein